MSAAVSDFPTGTRHPGGPSWAVMPHESPESRRRLLTYTECVSRKGKGLKTRKPPPKPTIPFLVLEVPCRSREGAACSFWGLFFPH